MYEFHRRLPKSLHPSIAILKAAYMFLERAYVHIEETEEEWIVHLSPKCDTDSQPAEFEDSLSAEFEDSLSAEFENEALAQTLREQVYQRTKTLREILLARAMTSTMIDRQDSLQQLEREDPDISPQELDDILTDWFERDEKNN